MAAFHDWIRRRNIIAFASSLTGLLATGAAARTIKGAMPWRPNAGSPPQPVVPGPWLYFTAEEASAVEALVDTIIPPDPRTPGGKDAGCAVFIDRQLSGPYGSSASLYMRGPFTPGTAQQGNQSDLTPAQRYRQALAAIADYTRRNFGGKPVNGLSPSQLQGLLSGLSSGDVRLNGADGKGFFTQLLLDTKAGFFSDPVYGGNRDMAGWKMIGFPGARYDYRDWVDRHNQPYPLPPVSILNR